MTEKCDMCAELRSYGEEPACVHHPARALKVGDIDGLRAEFGDCADVAPLPSSADTACNVVIGSPQYAKTEPASTCVSCRWSIRSTLWMRGSRTGGSLPNTWKKARHCFCCWDGSSMEYGSVLLLGRPMTVSSTRCLSCAERRRCALALACAHGRIDVPALLRLMTSLRCPPVRAIVRWGPGGAGADMGIGVLQQRIAWCFSIGPEVRALRTRGLEVDARHRS